jgi:nitrogenase-associated protein
MAMIVFYEKLGCQTNGRQRKILSDAGHTLVVRDLLSEPWSYETLLPFLENLPVSQWFNRASPRVKSGEISPETLDARQSMESLLSDHLLIRRPLIECNGKKMAGFEMDEISRLTGLSAPIHHEGVPDFFSCANE